jgi:hypothetical protein
MNKNNKGQNHCLQLFICHTLKWCVYTYVYFGILKYPGRYISKEIAIKMSGRERFQVHKGIIN